MAEKEKSLTKLQEKTEKLMGRLKGASTRLKEARDGASEANKMASKVPAPLLPVLGAGAGYAFGYADAMVNSPDAKNPVTIAIGGAAWLGSGVAMYFGQPTIATLAGTTAAVSAGIVTHSSGYEKGREVAARG